MAFFIPNNSLAFKKVARALAKNKGISFGQMFRRFAIEEIKKYDTKEYSNPHINTSESKFFLNELPPKLQREISMAARANGLSANEFCRHLLILLVNSEAAENKVYSVDSEELN